MGKSSFYIVEYNHDDGQFNFSGEMESELFIDGAIFDNDSENWIAYNSPEYNEEIMNKDIEGTNKLHEALGFINRKR